MKLIVNERICLAEIRASDKPALVQQLNDREIYERTLRIPYPYTEADADAFLALLPQTMDPNNHPTSWAIRNERDELIGGLGFNDFRPKVMHRAQIGYWLARPFWGQGIMTDVVRLACDFARKEWQVVKLEADVFVGNPASARVLEKCGFEREGLLRKHLRKDGRDLDVWLYGKVLSV